MRQIVTKTDGILDAAAQGDTRAVLALVKSGTNPNTTDARGATPVWVAAMNGHTDTVRALVKKCRADATTPTKGGETPVFAAAFSGHTETVRALVNECRADPNTADKSGLAPVVIAAHNDKSETVRALVDCGADPFPALRDAAIYDDTEMIWRLVRECGVDPACRNRDGEAARDLAPPLSRAYKLLEWLEGLKYHEHDLHAKKNKKTRAGGFFCTICSNDMKGDGIAFIPCGHRVCPGCREEMRARNLQKCPNCRAPILHSVLHNRFPDEHELCSRFCVQFPRARRL